MTDALLYSAAVPRHNEMKNAILLVAGTRIYLRKRLAFLRKMP